MRKLHFWVFFCICLAVGIGLGLVLRPAKKIPPSTIDSDTPTMLPPIRGVHVSSMTNSPDAKMLSRAGINAIVIDFPTADLVSISANAHKNKLQVCYAPKSVKIVATEVLAQAKLAAAAKVDVLLLGNGLTDTGPDEDTWTKIITDVRTHFPGRLAFVSDVTNYPYVTWWDLVDIVTVSGPFDLPNRPNITTDQLRASWNSHLLNLRSLAWRENKGLMMLNVTPSGKDNYNNAIIAATRALRGQEWFVGLAIQPPAPEIVEALGQAWEK